MPRLLLLAALLLAGLLIRQPLITIGALLFGSAALLAPAWARASLRAVSYQRNFQPPRAFPGESVAVTTRVHNDKLLPVPWLAVADENPEEAVWEHRPAAPGAGRQALSQVLSLRWFQRVTRHYRVCLPQRGLYAFGPATLYTGDAFGLEEVVAVSPTVDRLIVYPRLLEPPHLALLYRRPEVERPWQSSLWEDPTRLLGARAYQPGDPWRRIHWKASARLGQLQARVFEPAVSSGTAIFLDLRTVPSRAEGFHRGRLEAAITLAASIFRAELEGRRPAALFANGHMEEWGAGPAQPLTSDPAQLPALLEGLARLLPVPLGDVAPAIDRELPRLPRGTHLLLVAAQASPAWVAALAAAQAKGYPVTVLWLGEPDAAPAGLPLQAIDWREVG